MTPARLEDLIVEAAGREAYVARGDVHGALFWTDMVAALRRLQELTAAYQREHDIVDRIWKQLGFPTYEQLAGRSIYDLIDELKLHALKSLPPTWPVKEIPHADP